MRRLFTALLILVVSLPCAAGMTALRADSIHVRTSQGQIDIEGEGLVKLTYERDGRHHDLELPLALLEELAASLGRKSEPSSLSEKPTSRSLPRSGAAGKTITVKTVDGKSGMVYYGEMIVDSLITIRYREAGVDHAVTLPVEVLAALHGNHEAFSGAMNRESQFYVEPASGAFWFSISQGFNYKAVALVVGLLIGFIVLIAVRLSTWRIKKERDELIASRIRMMRIREAERSHLASELHDGPVQDVQRILRSQLARLAREEYRDLLDRDISELESTLRDVAGDLRNICSDLKPPVLVHFGLEKAVESCCRSFQLRNPDIEIRHDLSMGADDLAQETRLALYRILQEALNNIEKHADARSVTVELAERGREVRLVVSDDGRGFKRASRLSRLEERGHFGLSGMLQRAESVGGTVHIDSTVKRGTRIIALVPVDLPEGTPLFIDSMV